MLHNLRLRAVACGAGETCSSTVEPSQIAAALESAPIVARLALTSANDRVRARAAAQLGVHVAQILAAPESVSDHRQMSLL